MQYKQRREPVKYRFSELHFIIGISLVSIVTVALTLQVARKRAKSNLIYSLIPREAPTRPANPLLIKAFEYIQMKHIPPGIAIDFGAGYAGVESAYLLKRGYQVIAIDHVKEMLQVLASQKAIYPYRSQLRTIASRFEDLNWTYIPQVDLFIAFYSLSSKGVKDFPKVWKQIVAHIKPGSFFVGDLPPLPKNELIKLFDDFEIMYFDELNALLPKTNEEPQEGPPYYSVIARKK